MTIEEKDEIKFLFHVEKLSKTKISKIKSRSLSTIKEVLKNTISEPKKYDSTLRYALSSQQVEEVVQYCRENSLSSCKFLIEKFKLDCSQKTLSTRLRENGLRFRVATKKFCLSDDVKKKRLLFAKKVRFWTLDDWKKVVFVDESLIENNLHKTGNKMRLICKNKERQNPKNFDKYNNERKYKVNLFGFISYNKSEVYSFEDRMNEDTYLDILINQNALNLMNSNLPSENGKKSFFLQDNAKYHLTTNVRSEIASKFKILEIPPYSPDINCIENIWGILKARTRKSIRNQTFENSIELFNIIKNNFDSLEKEVRSVIESMPRRIKNIIENDGDMTRY